MNTINIVLLIIWVMLIIFFLLRPLIIKKEVPKEAYLIEPHTFPFESMEDWIVKYINNYRNSYQLPEIVIDKRAIESCKARTLYLKNEGFVLHRYVAVNSGGLIENDKDNETEILGYSFKTPNQLMNAILRRIKYKNLLLDPSIDSMGIDIRLDDKNRRIFCLIFGEVI